jgi:DNA-binding CsgD family transcriptional regulator
VSPNDQPDAPLRLPLALLLAAIALSGALDLALDRPTTMLSFHVLYELLLILSAGAGAVWLWAGWRGAARANLHLQRTLAERQAERDAWRASAEQALAGLGAAIDRQFERWELTPAEREIVLLLLKGRSHKEIAGETARSERTVRQHAAAAYRKAGLGGRAELAAFFLEGLMLPPGHGDPPGERAMR